MGYNLKKLKKKVYLSSIAKIVILIIICCLVMSGISPTINSVFIKNNDEKLEEEYKEEYKTTDYPDDDVHVYASFHWNPRYPDPGEEITFTSTSNAVHGHIVSQRWTFEDGTTYYGHITKHTFEEKGNYKVTLHVHAVGTGGSDWGLATRHVNIGADPFPKIKCKPIDPSPDEEVTLDASESNDPDGKIISYNWSFYNVENPENVNQLGTDEIIYHTWKKQGIYVVSLFIEDDKGNNNTIEITIHISVLKIDDFPKRSRGIYFEISNHGDFIVEDLKWDVDVYRYSRINIWSRSLYKKSGTVSMIDPDDSQIIFSKDFRRRFCKIRLVVTAKADNAVEVSKSFYGLMFGKYVYLSEDDFVDPYKVVTFAGLVLSLLLLILRSSR
jgi:hypothetical protein